MNLCDEIKNRGLVFNWDCLCRVDNVNSELFRNMREAGCCRVFFGIESGDNRIMKLMGKSFTVEEAQNAVRMAKNAGIEVGTFFMVDPEETEENPPQDASLFIPSSLGLPVIYSSVSSSGNRALPEA